MKHLQGLTVLVLGLGDSGLAMARWCARHGATVRAWDSRWLDGGMPPQAAAFDALPGASAWGKPIDSDETAHAALAGVQLVLKSPGLSPHDARIASLLAQAARTGLAVQGELDLYAHALVDLKAERGYAPEVLAITGTNGKTTTTALTALLVERCDRRVAVAGNIGPTLLDTLAAALDVQAAADAEARSDAQADAVADADAVANATLPQVWVLELSSFQLDGVRAFDPSAAVVLNLTQDHLDWHGTMAAYGAAKARIYGPTTVAVVNRDDAVAAALLPAPAPLAPKAKATTPPRRVIRFGLDAPSEPGDFGLQVDHGMAWLARVHDAEAPVGGRRRHTEPDDLVLQRLMPVDALHIRGRHNAANALAALALCHAIGLPLAPMLHALREYRGEPHRVEFVVTIDGVEAFDDSKGTNVGATVAAIRGLGEDRSPARVVVILGGDGKGQDFAPLAEPVARHARAVATIGRDAPSIEAALALPADGAVPLQRHASLEAATQWAFAQAKSGDAVLLSPACASFDMFRNYAHRAEVYVAAVRDLAAERGIEVGAAHLETST